mmetsp:Transcript_16786/g.27310  ORF Transcript_16786/g.27310 Transcript_16786/m.27310 type:complete len:228 (+) Transcript_16786:54-737(+)|eukprot:jgi/Bigna1/84588/fgenesh1_pg.165_\
MARSLLSLRSYLRAVMVAATIALVMCGGEEGGEVKQYIENGELVTAGSADSERSEAFMKKRIEKMQEHMEAQDKEEGIRFKSPIAEVDREVVEGKLGVDLSAKGKNRFDVRNAKQLLREGETSTVYVVQKDRTSWWSIAKYWVFNIVLVGGIYAYCRSPMAKYLTAKKKVSKKPDAKRPKGKTNKRAENLPAVAKAPARKSANQKTSSATEAHMVEIDLPTIPTGVA